MLEKIKSALLEVRKHRYSSLALLIILVVTLTPIINRITWSAGIGWDAFGYYYYLPLVFIQKSLIIESLDSVRPIFEAYKPSSAMYQFTHLENGNFIIRYTSGQAIMYSPFFFIAHLIAHLTDFPADGFSRPYVVAAKIGGAFYSLLGFVFLAKLLLKEWRDKVVGLTLIVLFFGTNLYSISFIAILSSQMSQFFLIGLLFLTADSYFKNKSLWKAIAMGAVFGLLCVGRPTEFITIIPLVLWPVFIPGLSVKEEFLSFIKRIPHLLGFIAAMSVFALIQFSYWKYVSGDWLIYSYGNPGEGLDFLSPHIIPFLFSFRSGWFIYTPLMLLVVGYLVKESFAQNRKMQVVLLYLIVFVYLASSWTNWWYGGGFSQRAMGQAYVLLALPLAGLIESVFFSPLRKNLVLKILIPCLIILSQWQTYQYKKRVLTSDTVTMEYYFASFFDTRPDPAKADLLDFSHDDHWAEPLVKIPDGYSSHKIFEVPLEADTVVLDEREFMPGFKIPYEELCPDDHCFIEITAVFHEEYPAKGRIVMHMERKEGSYHYQADEIHTSSIEFDSTANTYTVRDYYLTPPIRSGKDYLVTYVWNRNKEKGKLLEYRFEVFAPE